MRIRLTANPICSRIRQRTFKNRTRLGLRADVFIDMVIMGPPSAVAAVAVVIAINQILFRQVHIDAALDFNGGFHGANRGKSPARSTGLLVADSGHLSLGMPVKCGREPDTLAAKRWVDRQPGADRWR